MPVFKYYDGTQFQLVDSDNSLNLGGDPPSYYLDYTNLINKPTIEPVTFETLNSKSDVGTGSTQLAKGDHNHDSTYLGLNAKAADTDKVEGIDFYTGTTAPTGSTRLNMQGYFYATRVYNAIYNDYAEYFKKGEVLEPGDVVVLSDDPDNEEYLKSREDCSKFVVGVVSDDYAQCIGGKGDGNDNENFAAIGMAGRVKVKLVGVVKKGDLIVSSALPGIARALRKEEAYQPGTVIGKALEDKDIYEVRRIKMLIQLM
jgi:hypothetical protein